MALIWLLNVLWFCRANSMGYQFSTLNSPSRPSPLWPEIDLLKLSYQFYFVRVFAIRNSRKAFSHFLSSVRCSFNDSSKYESDYRYKSTKYPRIHSLTWRRAILKRSFSWFLIYNFAGILFSEVRASVMLCRHIYYDKMPITNITSTCLQFFWTYSKLIQTNNMFGKSSLDHGIKKAQRENSRNTYNRLLRSYFFRSFSISWQSRYGVLNSYYVCVHKEQNEMATSVWCAVYPA